MITYATKGTSCLDFIVPMVLSLALATGQTTYKAPRTAKSSVFFCKGCNGHRGAASTTLDFKVMALFKVKQAT